MTESPTNHDRMNPLVPTNPDLSPHRTLPNRAEPSNQQGFASCKRC